METPANNSYQLMRLMKEDEIVHKKSSSYKNSLKNKSSRYTLPRFKFSACLNGLWDGALQVFPRVLTISLLGTDFRRPVTCLPSVMIRFATKKMVQMTSVTL